MDARAFDTLTRRASLLTLGSVGLAGLAALANPIAGAAKQESKKSKKPDAFKLCKRQAAVWTDFINEQCEAAPSPECGPALACARPLTRCDFRGFGTCLLKAGEG